MQELSVDEQIYVSGGGIVEAAGMGGAVGGTAGLVVGAVAKGTLTAAAVGAAGFAAIGAGVAGVFYGSYWLTSKVLQMVSGDAAE